MGLPLVCSRVAACTACRFGMGVGARQLSHHISTIKTFFLIAAATGQGSSHNCLTIGRELDLVQPYLTCTVKPLVTDPPRMDGLATNGQSQKHGLIFACTNYLQVVATFVFWTTDTQQSSDQHAQYKILPNNRHLAMPQREPHATPKFHTTILIVYSIVINAA